MDLKIKDLRYSAYSLLKKVSKPQGEIHLHRRLGGQNLWYFCGFNGLQYCQTWKNMEILAVAWYNCKFLE